MAEATSAATQTGGMIETVNDRSATLAAELDKARQQKAALEAQAAALTAERDWLRTRVELAEQERLRLLDALPKALPPQRSWWRRIFRGKGDGGNA